MTIFGDHLRAIRQRAIRAGMRLLSVEECSEGERRPQSAAALPRNLKRLREARGWTVGQLSKASGVNRSTIRNVLDIDKAHNHTLEVILRLAQALGVGIQDLLEERP